MQEKVIISEEVARIIRNRVNNKITVSNDFYVTEILSDEWGLEARDLLAIMLEIEELFNIKFGKESINTIGFRCINDIVSAICYELGKNV